MGQQLVVEQDVAAGPERVYAAWTSGKAMATWWWPHIPDTTYEVDARVGGRYEIRSDAVGIGARGEYTRLEPPAVISMTWCWLTNGTGQDMGDVVEVRFAEQEGGTRVTLTHHLPDVAGDGADIRTGWVDVLGRLAKLDT